MHKKLLIALIFAIVLLPVGVILAQEENTLLVDDDILREDVTLLSEDLRVTPSGQIDGDIALFGGNATIAGTVNGDIVLFGGDLVLEETAVISGECVAIGGSLTGGAGTSCFAVEQIPALENLLNNLGNSTTPTVTVNSNVAAFFGAGFLSLLMGVVGAVVYGLAQDPTQRIEDTMRANPGTSIAVGLLSFVAIPFTNLVLLLISSILLIVCIGLIGFPIIFAITLGFVAAGVWAAVLWGKLFGQWVAAKLNRNEGSIVAVALGTAVVTFLFSRLMFSSAMGAAITILLLAVPFAWGMGATALTRFGTRPFPFIDEPDVIPALEPRADKITAVLETLDQ